MTPRTKLVNNQWSSGLFEFYETYHNAEGRVLSCFMLEVTELNLNLRSRNFLILFTIISGYYLILNVYQLIFFSINLL